MIKLDIEYIRINNETCFLLKIIRPEIVKYSHIKIVYDTIFKNNNDFEVRTLTKHNTIFYVSTNSYLSAMKQKYIPFNWYNTVGVLFKSRQEAVNLKNDVEREFTWKLLSN